MKTLPATLAYSYIRFSTSAQAEGDSLRRQTERAAAYCERQRLTLDTTLTLRDLGVSAFRGDNALVGNLGVFLKAVKDRKVVPGSVLIVESIDRISRQGIDEGYDLIKSILKADVRIVTLSPEREFDKNATKSLSKGALEIQLILERAAEESERKSDRLGEVWAEKRKRARAEGEVLTHQLPAWIEEHGGKLRLIPDKADVVRKIFQLAAEGHGHRRTAKWLIEKGVPHLTAKGRWDTAYVGYILKDRRAIGEFQPCSRGESEGEPIPNYYPAAVSENDWLRARAGAAQRAHKRGRVGKFINVFAGLVRNARDGSSYFADLRLPSKCSGPARRMLVNGSWSAGRAGLFSFPLETFERAILSALAELDPRELLPQVEERDEEAILVAEVAGLDAELADAAAFMESHGFSPTIGKRVTDLEARKRDLAAKLVDARARASCPAGEAWKEFGSLLSVLDNSPDVNDARMRLRSALRRTVEEIQMLVVPRIRDRLAAVQVSFPGGARRDYLILHRPHRGNGKARKEGWFKVRSITDKEMAAVGLTLFGGDLRDPDDSANTLSYLESLPQDLLEGAVFGAYSANAIQASQ
jgi:DNA invertase Pin-like site-specific DNA recombinase